MYWELTANNAVDYLNKKLIENLLIPMPSLDTKKKVVKILDKAYQNKIENQKNAQKLLSSIDSYLKKQLGIAYTEPEEKKTYVTNAQELQSKRHDPYYYNPNFIELEKMLLKSGAVKLNTLLKSITNGIDYRKFSEEGQLKYLRVSNIKPYKIDYSDAKKVALNKSDITKNIFGKKYDILLTRKGTYGISVFLEQDLDALISSEVFVIKIDASKINSKYLSIFLNSSLGQKQFLRNKVGTIMGSLSQEAVKDAYVVIPNEAKQLDIVNQIDKTIIKARELQQQAEKIVKQAKKKVKEMILN